MDFLSFRLLSPSVSVPFLKFIYSSVSCFRRMCALGNPPTFRGKGRGQGSDGYQMRGADREYCRWTLTPGSSGEGLGGGGGLVGPGGVGQKAGAPIHIVLGDDE